MSATDRELLDLAAKAAGIDLRWPIDPESDLCARRADNWNIWNPLTDDGDALRLAVKLKILIDTTWNTKAQVSWRDGYTPLTYHVDCTSKTRDAATRRAIVRAAAEIGRSMP